MATIQLYWWRKTSSTMVSRNMDIPQANWIAFSHEYEDTSLARTNKGERQVA
jgi:hypothetical protein